MGKGRVLIGSGDGRAPSYSSAEHAAMEYFQTRASAGVHALKPPVERWSADQRERFEKELARLEAQRERQRVLAVEQAGRLSDEQFAARLGVSRTLPAI
jgi:uncharacterized membrane protein YgcG